MITSMTVIMMGLSPLLPILHIDDRPPLLADGLPAKGEDEYIRIQGNSCRAYTGPEVRICLYLYTDGAGHLAEACQGHQPWSRACQRPPLAFFLPLWTIQQRLGV